MALLGPLTLESASPWVLVARPPRLSRRRSGALRVRVQPGDAASFGGFYMRVWALFFVEYLLMPAAVLAEPGLAARRSRPHARWDSG